MTQTVASISKIETHGKQEKISAHGNRINLFVFSRQKGINLANFLIRSSTHYSALFHKQVQYVKVGSLDELDKKITHLMKNHPDAYIGTLWLDSHGVYLSGKSLVVVGKDSISFSNISSPQVVEKLKPVARFCDDQTNIVLGACYASANYQRPGNDRLSAAFMNGDSLMRGLGKIFFESTIIGTSSWVMTEPFLFGKKWGLAGYPLERKFKDEIYYPAWIRMGNWKSYENSSGKFQSLHTLYLSRDGSVLFNAINYLDQPRARKKMEKNLSHLRPDVYHF